MMMAEDAVKEQVYTIPLRSIKELPRYRRADKAMTLIRNYLTKHMKVGSDQVKLHATINEKVWERGMQKPPSFIRVRAAKFEDGVVEAELA
jgi:large subunit ribosomal protein L31e